MTFYVILWRSDQRLMYAGKSELDAALALVPGTTYGKADTHEAALLQAQKRSEAVKCTTA